MKAVVGVHPSSLLFSRDVFSLDAWVYRCHVCLCLRLSTVLLPLFKFADLLYLRALPLFTSPSPATSRVSPSRAPRHSSFSAALWQLGDTLIVFDTGY